MDQQKRVLENKREALRGQLSSTQQALASSTDPSAQDTLLAQVESIESAIADIDTELGMLEVEQTA